MGRPWLYSWVLRRESKQTDGVKSACAGYERRGGDDAEEVNGRMARNYRFQSPMKFRSQKSLEWPLAIAFEENARSGGSAVWRGCVHQQCVIQGQEKASLSTHG